MIKPTVSVVILLVGCGAPAPPPAPAPPRVTEEPVAGPPRATYSPGLEVVDAKVGSGPACKAGDKITVRYVGKLDDGNTFDESAGATFPIGTGMLIKGWDEGIPGMRVGGVRRLTIPASLGYGAKGAPPKIPPFSVLYFEVELLAIEG